MQFILQIEAGRVHTRWNSCLFQILMTVLHEQAETGGRKKDWTKTAHSPDSQSVHKLLASCWQTAWCIVTKLYFQNALRVLTEYTWKLLKYKTTAGSSPKWFAITFESKPLQPVLQISHKHNNTNIRPMWSLLKMTIIHSLISNSFHVERGSYKPLWGLTVHFTV